MHITREEMTMAFHYLKRPMIWGLISGDFRDGPLVWFELTSLHVI